MITPRIAIIAVLALSYAPWAVPARADTGLCDDAARHAAAFTGVPVDLLRAITLTETRQNGAPWPWSVNLDGAAFYYADREAAIAAAEGFVADGGDPDIGCFQLNTRWHGDAFANLARMFDPTENATYAAGFLKDLHREKGNWTDAVAAYHSRDPDNGLAYVARVGAALSALSPDMPVAAARTGYGEPRRNDFPLLMAGDPGAAGSVVPRLPGITPLIGGP